MEEPEAPQKPDIVAEEEHLKEPKITTDMDWKAETIAYQQKKLEDLKIKCEKNGLNYEEEKEKMNFDYEKSKGAFFDQTGGSQ